MLKSNNEKDKRKKNKHIVKIIKYSFILITINLNHLEN